LLHQRLQPVELNVAVCSIVGQWRLIQS
jgi:hypothetical protein